MTHLICPNDGTENPSAALLCARCGARLSRVEAGLTFYNRYQIDQLLGKTETGFDYRVQNAITGKRCLLREIVPDVAAQHDDLYRFYEAARHLTQVAPHSLVPTLEYFTYRSRFYLVEESCELTSLRDAIDTKGSLSEPLAARLFRRMLAGLSELYSLEPAVYVGAIGPRGVLLSGVDEPVFLESQYVIDAVFGRASDGPDIKFGKDLYACAVVAIAALLGEALPSKSCFPEAITTIGNLAFSASLEWILISSDTKPESPSQVGQFWELMESAASELSGGNAVKAVELFSDAYHLSGSPRVEAALNDARKALPEPSIEAPAASIQPGEATPVSAVEKQSLPLEAAVATALLETHDSAMAEAVPELEPVREVMRAMAATASAGHESVGVTEPPPVVQQVDHAEPSGSDSSEATLATALLEPPGPAMAEAVAELEPVRDATHAEAVTASTKDESASITEKPLVVQKVEDSEPSESDSSYDVPPAEPWWTFLLRRKLLVGGCLLLLVVGVGTWLYNRHSSESLVTDYAHALDEQRFFAPAANNAYDLRQKAIHDYGDKSALVQSMNQKVQAPLQQWSDAQFRTWREGLDFKLAQWEELSKAEGWLVSMNPTDPAILAHKDYADAEVHYLRGEYQEANDGFQKALQRHSDWDLANLSYGDSCQALKMYECAANYYSKAKAEAPMWAWPERRLSGLHQPDAVPSVAPVTAAAPAAPPVTQPAPPEPTERADSRGPKIVEFSGRAAKGSCEFWILHWQVNGATSVKIDFNSRPIDIQPTDGQAGKVVKLPGHYELKASNSFGTAVRPLLLTVPPGAKPCN